MAKIEVSSTRRATIHPRRCSKERPEAEFTPYRTPRRTQRLIPTFILKALIVFPVENSQISAMFMELQKKFSTAYGR
jgi:hypothetical protein